MISFVPGSYLVDEYNMTIADAAASVVQMMLKSDVKALNDYLTRRVAGFGIDTYLPYPYTNLKLAAKRSQLNAKCM